MVIVDHVPVLGAVCGRNIAVHSGHHIVHGCYCAVCHCAHFLLEPYPDAGGNVDTHPVTHQAGRGVNAEKVRDAIHQSGDRFLRTIP